MNFQALNTLPKILMGWARAQLRSPSEGVVLIRQGLCGLDTLGSRLRITNYLTSLSEAQALDGKIDDALVTIEEALSANPMELVFRPNALICRGKLQLKIRKTELGEADFRDAIALSREMSAKLYELRATTSLAAVPAQQGRRDEARKMLAEIYGSFTQGLDTADLKDAKAC
jgi:predicted ATPase